MLPGIADILPLAITFAVPFALVVLLMPRYLGFLRSRGRLATDVHKREAPRIPTPAGPLLIIALVLGEAVAFLFYGTIIPLVLIGVVLVAGAIGLADDLRTLSGKVKPALMLLAAIPILVGGRLQPGLYDPRLYFPLFASTGTHFIIFGILILASVPVVSNAFNMMDAFNGEISWFTLIAGSALLVAVVMRASVFTHYSMARVAMTVPLVAVSLSFLLFNRYPSRAFDGDSGSLTFGALYVSLAFLGGIEFAALVAIIPAILNSFYILSSVKGIVEHRKIAVRPTFLREDGLLQATGQAGAPATLARMILLDGPLSERGIVWRVIALTVFASTLSVITAALTWLV